MPTAAAPVTDCRTTPSRWTFANQHGICGGVPIADDAYKRHDLTR
jgi:hypothetical protein